MSDAELLKDDWYFCNPTAQRQRIKAEFQVIILYFNYFYTYLLHNYFVYVLPLFEIKLI